MRPFSLLMLLVLAAPALAQKTDVKILSTRLVPSTFTTNGRVAQDILLELKNTGTRPIYRIKLDIVPFDSQGKRLYAGAAGFTIYSKSKPIQPGQIFRSSPKEGKVFTIIPPNGRAKRVTVRILAVDHVKPK
jgi:hypothetical protein